MHLLIRKRRRKEKNETTKSQESKDREEVSTEIIHTRSQQVGVSCNIANGDIRSINDHLWRFNSGKGWLGDYNNKKYSVSDSSSTSITRKSSASFDSSAQLSIFFFWKLSTHQQHGWQGPQRPERQQQREQWEGRCGTWWIALFKWRMWTLNDGSPASRRGLRDFCTVPIFLLQLWLRMSGQTLETRPKTLKGERRHDGEWVINSACFI